MKKILLVPLIALALIFNGCALIPKNVEFFQKKVKAFPEASAKHEEVQRQVAQRAKESAQETLKQVIQSADTNAVAPATDTALFTDAISQSLGPPLRPSVEPAPELVQELRNQIARLNKKIDAFAAANEKIEGKKVEGTGWLQIPYFVYLGVVLLVIVAGWHLLHTVVTGLQVAGVANPALGVAGSVGGAALSEVEALFHKGFTTVKADILAAVQKGGPGVTS